MDRVGMACCIVALVLCLGSVVSYAETSSATARQKLSRPGGAGHALLLQNHIAKVPSFKGFPADAITFEAWVSTTDFCHSGTILSYAKKVDSQDQTIRTAAANHFTIFNSLNVIGCHDFETLSGTPDSCLNAFTPNKTASVVTRDGSWRHIAVTWNAKLDGLTKVYVDGSLMASAFTKKTKPLEADGVLLLGQEQDCLGGCTDSSQSFQGLMDEVRIWKTERTQDEIARYMRWTDGLESDKNLVAYWKFNDPDNDGGNWKAHAFARDSSSHGNDLVLVEMPKQFSAEIHKIKTGAMAFRGQFAHSWNAPIPDKDFTIEFWARANKLKETMGQEMYNTLLDFATLSGGTGSVHSMDDAIRIERYSYEYKTDLRLNHSTVGAIGVHINANWDNVDSKGLDSGKTNWIDFLADWVDDKWHHIAVTWEYETGTTRLYMDGAEKPAFWRHNQGAQQTFIMPNFAPSVATKTNRLGVGSLVLGMDQHCYGGCMDPGSPANADLAVLRIWKTVRNAQQIQRNMMYEVPVEKDGLLFYYTFPKPSNPSKDWLESYATAVAPNGGIAPVFYMYSPAANFVYSTAPLTTSDGMPVATPTPGQAGHALSLSDQQVVVVNNFHNFPSTAITFEFWMRSIDTCRQGVPISYATGEYRKGDNSFLIFNYNSLGLAVMEDQGSATDKSSGVKVTDGQWHHVAVTWESASGRANMYVDTNLVWSGVRAQGQSIPSGGTLVIGREQDCQGGCFDSLSGASGNYDSNNEEYGPQDFTGAIEQVRIWRTVRTSEEIQQYYADDALMRRLGSNHPDLVAHWEFDEGTGYKVVDLTKNKHDLTILSNPKFEVVKWLGVCGNGIVEGNEECDLGNNNRPGRGCTPACKREPGWSCTIDPNMCYRTDGTTSIPTHTWPSTASETSSRPTPSRIVPHSMPKQARGSRANSWGIALGAIAAVGVLGVVGYMWRDALHEHVWMKILPGRNYHELSMEYDLAEPPRALTRELQADYHPLPHGP